jgi:hypothetical protein
MMLIVVPFIQSILRNRAFREEIPKTGECQICLVLRTKRLRWNQFVQAIIMIFHKRALSPIHRPVYLRDAAIR